MKLLGFNIAFYFLWISNTVCSQSEFSKWYFGNYCGLNFSTNPPTAIANSSANTGEGISTLCDASGNLLFYTDGLIIRNSTQAIMANGTGLNGGSGGAPNTTQDGLAVKQPGNNPYYYIFSIQSFGGNMYYSIVDMSLASGQGSVVTKNAWVYNQSTEKHVAIRHCNGRDIWLLSHEFGTNNFRAYLLTSTGLSINPVISSVGPTPIGTNQSTGGELKISPDGKKLAMAVAWESNPISAGLPGFYLFDFDASSGVVSNSLILNNAPGAYGIEFSPDGRKLYGATSVVNSFTNTFANNLYQWNICAPSASAIVASQYSIGLGNIISGSLQWAIDGKIYLAVSVSQSISVINNPNLTGAAMGFSPYAVSLAPKWSGLGLPNYLNRYTRPAPSVFSSSISCQQVGFSVPALPSFSSGCSSTPYPPSGYLWNFGDPASGSANSSTSSSPTHLYANLGTYTAQLIVYNACGNDTLSQVLSISNVGPVPSVAGPSLICKGDRYTYNASGGNTYNWSTGATTNTVALNPTVTTVYTLTATQNGCSVAKVFTVNVNPCLGIEAQSQGAGFSLYPNPVQDLLTLRSARACHLSVSDMQGREVLSQDLQAGENSLNTAQLAQGFYTLQFSDTGRTWWMKLLKTE